MGVNNAVSTASSTISRALGRLIGAAIAPGNLLSLNWAHLTGCETATITVANEMSACAGRIVKTGRLYCHCPPQRGASWGTSSAVPPSPPHPCSSRRRIIRSRGRHRQPGPGPGPVGGGGGGWYGTEKCRALLEGSRGEEASDKIDYGSMVGGEYQGCSQRPWEEAGWG